MALAPNVPNQPKFPEGGAARSMQDMGLGEGRGLATSQTSPSFPGPDPGVRDFPSLAQESGSGAEARRRAQTPDILSRWPEMISKPHKSWSRGGGSTIIPTRCGLDSGASEINIIREAFSSKFFLLPSLPRGPEAQGNGAEEAGGKGKERKCVFLEGLQPSSRSRAVLHVLHPHTSPLGEALSRFTDEKTGAQRERKLSQGPSRVRTKPSPAWF